MTFFSNILNKLKQPSALAEITDPNKIDIDFKYYEYEYFIQCILVMLSITSPENLYICYANIASDLHLDKASLGWIGSVLAISYGISKFVSGIILITNARYFMAIGTYCYRFIKYFIWF